MESQILNELRQAMFEYDEEMVLTLAKKSIEEKIDINKTITVLTESIAQIGDKFDIGELFLPDLMIAAKTMKIALKPLEEELKIKKIEKKSAGKVVIGTVYGDLHDVGKNMVLTFLVGTGFNVIDLGINVETSGFVEAIKKYDPDILAMSSLLTTTAPEQSKTISTLEKEGIRNKIKIIVGGGPITKEFADKIGADGYAPTATLAVNEVKYLLEKAKKLNRK